MFALFAGRLELSQGNIIFPASQKLSSVVLNLEGVYHLLTAGTIKEAPYPSEVVIINRRG